MSQEEHDIITLQDSETTALRIIAQEIPSAMTDLLQRIQSSFQNWWERVETAIENARQ